MNLVRWQPRTVARNHGDHLAADWDRLFDWAFGPSAAVPERTLVPAIDVTEEDGRYVVHADLPGLGPDDIEITYQDQVLTVKGEKTDSNDGESGRFRVRERFAGKFARTLRLSEKVDAEKIEARFENGVLRLVLPFTPEARPKRIEIRG